MSEPTPAKKRTLYAVSIALVGVTAAVIAGRAVLREPDTERPLHFLVDWPDGGVPTGDVKCVWTTALVQSQVLAAYGGQADAGSQYAYARICAERPDGGVDVDDDDEWAWMLPSLPEGIEAMAFEQTEEPFDGGPQLEAFLQGFGPWPCACSSGSGCESQQFDMATFSLKWEPAPLGITLPSGEWRSTTDGGCVPKSCVELAGTPSWPTGEECPLE